MREGRPPNLERQGGHFESGVELFFLRRTNRSLRTRDSDRDHARLFALYGSPVVNSDTPDERARERESDPPLTRKIRDAVQDAQDAGEMHRHRSHISHLPPFHRPLTATFDKIFANSPCEVRSGSCSSLTLTLTGVCISVLTF